MTEAIQTRLAEDTVRLLTDVKEAQAFEIRDQQDLDLAAQAIRHLSKRRKAIEAERKEATKPINDSLKRIRGWFKPVEDRLSELETIYKGKVRAFEIRKAEANRLALLEAQAAAQAEDKAGMVEALDSVVHTDRPAGISYREVQDFEVVDIKAVPWEYLKVEVNRSALLRALRDGVEVPGVRGFKRQDVAVGR